MKRILCLFLAALMLISLSGCTTKAKLAKQLAEDTEALSPYGEVEVIDGVATIPVKMPASLIGGATQAQLDEMVGMQFVTARLNADGSADCRMNRTQYFALLKELTDSMDEGMRTLIDTEGYNIENIQHNSNYTQYDVTLSTDTVGAADSFAAVALYIYGGMYGMFANCDETIVVNYYGPAGNLLDTVTSEVLAAMADMPEG